MIVTAPISMLPTMTPRAVQLLGAMRRNLELLVELEKSDPAGVVTIVSALISHLRSWMPLVTTAVAPLDSGPVARMVVPIDPASRISRELYDGHRYEVSAHAEDYAGGDRCVVLTLHDEGDRVVAAFDPAQAETLRADVARVLAMLAETRR